jgi:hypothetical protein
MTDERLKSCSTVLGGTGNRYDAGPCGMSDGTFGNASKMSRSNGVSFFEDADIGDVERRELGVSEVMGGSMGDCSGMASSGNTQDDGSALAKCDQNKNHSPGSSNIDFVLIALLKRRSAKELALETLRRGERLSLLTLLLLRMENMLRMLMVSFP